MMRKRQSRGEMVEVHGGRIVRSTGGKDRHSKVCTAKGTRDRRVRLAAHTAIQFYDVQDRLGFDRPSRAVDWLINKAKAAIDELDELPPWNPSDSKTLDVYGESSSLFPPSIDSDPIKASADAQFQSYQSDQDFVHMRCSGQGGQSQDLKLSLHSHGQSQQLFSESSQIGFDGNSSAGWAESQRLIGWNSGGGFMVIPPQGSQQQLVFGSHGVGQAATHWFSQRGPLQSSNSPSNGAQMGGGGGGNSQSYHQAMPSVSGIGFASSGGFSGFPFAAQVRGDQEDHDGGDPSKASSVSSASRRH